MLELPMAPACGDQKPAIVMKYPQYLANLHERRILPLDRAVKTHGNRCCLLFRDAPMKNKGRRLAPLFALVEVAGVEPASASPTALVLHAYSVYDLTHRSPADRVIGALSLLSFSAGSTGTNQRDPV